MQPIRTFDVFKAEAIAASGDATSGVVDMNQNQPAGYFSIYIELTGTGTAQVVYELSNDGVNYLTPVSASDIVAAHTAASGAGANGKDLYSFTPELARYIRIKITETGGANPIVVTAVLAIQ
jgi:hypothetical protein